MAKPAKSVVLSTAALSDIDSAVTKLHTRDPAKRLAWIDSLQLCLAHLSHMGDAGNDDGSLQLWLQWPGLRMQALHAQSHQVYALISTDAVRVLRVLPAQ